jgi:hypothetical protein
MLLGELNFNDIGTPTQPHDIYESCCYD